jgi:hypothetical protein
VNHCTPPTKVAICALGLIGPNHLPGTGTARPPVLREAMIAWRMYNNTSDTHPIHLHQTSFQVLTRGTFSSKIANLGFDPATGLTRLAMGPVTKVAPLPVPANEVAWKDTIQINPGEVITLRAKFDLGGKYVWHCHILSHEEHDMMRFFQVGNNPAPQPGVVVTSTGAVLQTGALATPAAGDGAGAIVNSLDVTFSNQPVLPALKEEQALQTIADQVLV